MEGVFPTPKLLRPVCNQCGTVMKVVKINSCKSTVFYWDCECVIDYFYDESTDPTVYI